MTARHSPRRTSTHAGKATAPSPAANSRRRPPVATRPTPRMLNAGFMSPPTVLSDCKKGGKVNSRCAWLQKRILAFNQNEVFDGRATDTYKALMAEKGFAFVPKQCQQGQPCALHANRHAGLAACGDTKQLLLTIGERPTA